MEVAMSNKEQLIVMGGVAAGMSGTSKAKRIQRSGGLADEPEEGMIAHQKEMNCKRGFRFYYPIRISGGKGAYESLQAPAVILGGGKGFIKAAYFDEVDKNGGKKIKYLFDRCSHFFQNFAVRERKEYAEEVDHLLDHLSESPQADIPLNP